MLFWSRGSCDENFEANWVPHEGLVSPKSFWKFVWMWDHTTTILRPFFRDHPGEPVPEENFWTLWCKGRLTEADTPTIRLGTTPARLFFLFFCTTYSGLFVCFKNKTELNWTSTIPPFFTGWMPFLPSNQQCQSTKGNQSTEGNVNECETIWGLKLWGNVWLPVSGHFGLSGLCMC